MLSKVNDLLLTNNVLFVGTDKNILAIDIANPNNPKKIADIDSIKSLSFSAGALYVVSNTGISRFSSPGN